MTTQQTLFKTYGYFKDYYLNGKYMGSVNTQDKDRDVMGYTGRKTEVTTNDIIFHNNKRIPKGSTVVTELQVLCGRVKK